MEVIFLSNIEPVQYKCPNCNAELKFNPENQELSCDYCGSSFPLEEVKELYGENSESETVTEETAPESDEFSEHTNVYHCASCGADIIADEGQTALFCYYCHNPVILSGKITGEYKPDKVIGFKIKREQALEMFKKWCWSKKFVPKDFRTEQQLEKMTGLYVPFWIADCRVQADYHGIGKRVRSWTSGEYNYTETTEFMVVRDGEIDIKGVPADGESKIDDLLMESIEPFDYKEMKNFDMTYLSGFFADRYDVGKSEVFPRIRERVNDASKRVIYESISGYTSVVKTSENYRIKQTDWKYIMLPVWFMTYSYNEKVYEFALNGQTGKIAGTPPLDVNRLRLFCLLIGIAVTILGYIGGLLLL